MIRELLFRQTDSASIRRPKAGYWKLVGDGTTVYALLPDGTYVDLGAGSETVGVTGTYTVGLGAITDGTITVTNGVITAVQEAT